MPNTILTPEVLALESVAVLRNENITYGLMRNPAHEAMYTGTEKKGNTFKVRVPGPATISDFDGTAVTDNVTEASVDVTVERYPYRKVAITAEQWTLDLQNFVQQVVEPSMAGIADDMNAYFASKALTVPYFSGTAGDPPDSVADLAAVGKVLSDNKAPKRNRIAIGNTSYEADFISTEAFHAADKRGDQGTALREASMGRIGAMDHFMEQGVLSHTRGTLTSPVVNGAVSADATTMNVDGGAGSETMLKGDLFTVAGASGQYVVMADATASGGDITGLTFFPEAPTGGFADDAALTVVDDHAKNFAFAPGAFTAVAFAPLASQATRSFTFTDGASGLAVNVTFAYNSVTLSDEVIFSTLCGAALIQPEKACIVLG